MTRRHPALRIALLTLGGLLLVGAVAIGPLPGPGGVFLFAGGAALILRNSRWAKRRFVTAKQRWPRFGRLADRALRRPSARRRGGRETAGVAR